MSSFLPPVLTVMIRAKKIVDFTEKSQDLLSFYQHSQDSLFLRQDFPEFIQAKEAIPGKDDLYLIGGVVHYEKIIFTTITFPYRIPHV
jgi:hypothetical protein